MRALPPQQSGTGSLGTGLILANVGLNQLILLDVRMSSGVATIESENRRSRVQTSG